MKESASPVSPPDLWAPRSMNIEARTDERRVVHSGTIVVPIGHEFQVDISQTFGTTPFVGGTAVTFRFLIREAASGEDALFSIAGDTDEPKIGRITLLMPQGSVQGGVLSPVAVAKVGEDTLSLTLVISRVQGFYQVEHTWYLHESEPSDLGKTIEGQVDRPERKSSAPGEAADV